MEPVWVWYGSGMGPMRGFAGLTHRAVGFVKVLVGGASQVWFEPRLTQIGV